MLLCYKSYSRRSQSVLDLCLSIYTIQPVLYSVVMPPHPDMEIVGMDQERKKELVMEKRLRAARVNIIPRVGTPF